MPRLGQFTARALHEIGLTIPVAVSSVIEWMVLLGGFPTTSATVYAINNQTSSLSTVSTLYSSFAASSYHFDAAVAPKNDFIYFPNGNKNWIDIVPISTSTGVYTGSGATTSTVNSGSSFPIRIKISPDGKNAYVGYNNSGVIGIMTRNTSTGALTTVSNVSTGTADGIVLSNDGFNFYSVTLSGIPMYSRNTATGALSYLGTEGTVSYNGPSFFNNTMLTLTQDGTSLFACDFTTQVLYAYNRNTSTGILTWNQSISTAPFYCQGAAVSSDGKFVYVGLYDPNQATGTSVLALSRSISSPYTLTTSTTYYSASDKGGQVQSLIISKNQDVLAWASTNGIIHSWKRNLTTGALTTNTDITGVAAGGLAINN